MGKLDSPKLGDTKKIMQCCLKKDISRAEVKGSLSSSGIRGSIREEGLGMTRG